ncbi:MAG: HD domain-containing protein [Candidatus Omnitrophota bacterium]
MKLHGETPNRPARRDRCVGKMARNKKRSTASPLANFIFEAGMLKRLPRSGWSVVGVKNPESVADHSFRCGVIGYLLARMEGAPLDTVLLMTLFNDIHESRITDMHKMAQRYIDAEAAEGRSFKEQIEELSGPIRKELTRIRREYVEQRTAASVIARDADILECLIQAKEYHEAGFLQAVRFTEKAPRFLKTKSARNIWKAVQSAHSGQWWEKLGDFKR